MIRVRPLGELNARPRTMNPSQNHGAAMSARRRRFMISQLRQMMSPPNAGVSRKLPRMAITGLQIVSPSGGTAAEVAPGAGIDLVAGMVDPSTGSMLGKGGGPAAGIGIGIGIDIDGNGG